MQLGSRFPEVQYFFTYPLIDFFAWARIVEGKLVRGFAIGDQGILLNRGKPTREERRLGLKLFEMRGVKERTGDAGGELMLHPTEDHVMRLAQAWASTRPGSMPHRRSRRSVRLRSPRRPGAPSACAGSPESPLTPERGSARDTSSRQVPRNLPVFAPLGC